MESDYIKILCGVFKDDHVPLSRAEFWKLYHKYNDSLRDLAESGEEKVERLLERSAAISFAEETLKEMGIRICTFLDEDFPEKLYQRLGDFCPPLLYACGKEELLYGRYAGYVGSRAIEEEDASWTKRMVEKNLQEGYGIVSGGAKGIDSISINHCLENGGNAAAFLPDSLKAWIRDQYYREQVIDGRLLLMSHVSPFAKKTRNSFVAAAMERNKLIYAMSAATAVVRSDIKRGGTWAGATEALRHKWAPVFVWDNKKYEGNQQLIKLGGIPLSDEGKKVGENPREEKPEEGGSGPSEAVQMNLFDYLDQKK